MVITKVLGRSWPKQRWFRTQSTDDASEAWHRRQPRRILPFPSPRLQCHVDEFRRGASHSGCFLPQLQFRVRWYQQYAFSRRFALSARVYGKHIVLLRAKQHEHCCATYWESVRINVQQYGSTTYSVYREQRYSSS